MARLDFFSGRMFLAICAVSILMLDCGANAQPPRGRTSSRTLTGGTVAPSTPGDNPVVDNTAQLEIGQYQQIREEALLSMERTLQQRKGFRTARQHVDARMAGLKPLDESGMPQSLVAFVTAARKLVELRKGIDSNPAGVFNNIEQIVHDFEITLAALEDLKAKSPNTLAADLLAVAITTVDKSVAGQLDLHKLLPALLKNFTEQLGLHQVLGAVLQSEPINPTPSQTAFNTILKARNLDTKLQTLVSP